VSYGVLFGGNRIAFGRGIAGAMEIVDFQPPLLLLLKFDPKSCAVPVAVGKGVVSCTCARDFCKGPGVLGTSRVTTRAVLLFKFHPNLRSMHLISGNCKLHRRVRAIGVRPCTPGAAHGGWRRCLGT
jgi:hypothetical protein